jgi:adenine-specific DNA-methyltransferase
MAQIRLLVSNDNHKIFVCGSVKGGSNKDGYTKVDFICPLTGKAFKKRGEFWNYMKDSNIQPQKMTYDRQLNVENEENISKLFDKTNIEYLWQNYFEMKGNKKLLENLVGQINLELYIILLKVYNGVMDIDECIDECDNVGGVTEGSNIEKFNELSIILTKKLTIDHKKKHGIYFTHPNEVNKTIEILSRYGCKYDNILEPSCGSCEFVRTLSKLHPNSNIDCVEYDKTIFKEIKSLQTDKINIVNDDFVKYECNKNYDLIIGNPPYFVIKKDKCPKEYHNYLDGRPNIYLLFILKCLTILNDNGILAFILPNNFLNCSYYNKVRIHIKNNYKLIDIIDCGNDFIDTEQHTHLLIVQNKIELNNKNIIELNNSVIFNTTDKIYQLNNLYTGTDTLDNMGFSVSVGKVVWNQVKDELTDDNRNTLLIYSGDIKNNRLESCNYKDETKKNYIISEGKREPTLVVNRGYGKGKYTFNYCLIDIDKPYQIENHLICISPKNNMNKKELLKQYNKIIDSFNNPKTNEFVDIYCTNDAMNTTELQYILPIYI